MNQTRYSGSDFQIATPDAGLHLKTSVLRTMTTMLALLVSINPSWAALPAENYNLPAMGQPADTAMPPAEQRKLGIQVVHKLRQQNAILNDPELEAYINRIGHRLVRHTDRKADDIHYYVINDQDVNSFALPGGNIGIFTGLITATHSESELAAVMAHETAHEVLNHIPRQIAESKGDAIATLAATLAAAAVGSMAGADNAAPAAMAAGMSHLGQQQINYTRAHEYEADRVGIRILAAAGYDPNAMAAFFKELQRNTDLYGQQLPQILLTHPITTTRISEAQARAAQYPHVNVRTDPSYPFMKARARVLGAARMSSVEQYYQRQLSTPSATAADRYGYALTLMRLGRTQKAIAILKPRASANPDQLPWTLALAEAESNAGKVKRAIDILNSARKRFPHSDTVKFDYAKALKDGGKLKAMRDFLLSQPQLLSTMPEAQKLLADGAGKQDHLGEAYYRLARYYAMLDNYPAAISQLGTALHTVKLSAYDKSRLRALQEQMISRCRQTWSPRECREQIRADLRQ